MAKEISITCINCGLWQKINMTKGLCLDTGKITDHAAKCDNFISKSDLEKQIKELDKKKEKRN